MRRRIARTGLPSDLLSVDRAARLPDRRLRLRPGRGSSRHRPLAGASLFVRLAGCRDHGGNRACHQRAHAPLPFYMVALMFAAAFGTLAISFWPYMIPFSITVQQAAAPHGSLAFLFWGEGLVL